MAFDFRNGKFHNKSQWYKHIMNVFPKIEINREKLDFIKDNYFATTFNTNY